MLETTRIPRTSKGSGTAHEANEKREKQRILTKSDPGRVRLELASAAQLCGDEKADTMNAAGEVDSHSSPDSSYAALRRKREIGIVFDPDAWETLFVTSIALLMVVGGVLTAIYVPTEKIEATLLFKRIGYQTSCFLLDFAPLNLISSAVYSFMLVIVVMGIIMRLARAAALHKIGRMSSAVNVYYWCTAVFELIGYCVFSLSLSVQPDQNIYIHVLSFAVFIFTNCVCGSIRNMVTINVFGLQRSQAYYKLLNCWYITYIIVSIFWILALVTIPFYEHPPLYSITQAVDITWSTMFVATIYINFLEGFGSGFLKISFEFIDNESPDFNDDVKFYAFADGHLDEDDVDDFYRDVEETSCSDTLMRYSSVFWILFFLGLVFCAKTPQTDGSACANIDYLPGWNGFQVFIQVGTVISGLCLAVVHLPSYWRLLHEDQSKTEHKFSKYFCVPGGFAFAVGNGLLMYERLFSQTIPAVSTPYAFGACTFMQIVGLSFLYGYLSHENFPKYSIAQRLAAYFFALVVIVTMLGRFLALVLGDFPRYYQGASCPFSKLLPATL